MPDTAVTQAPRLIELLAWLSQRDSATTITYKAAAKRFGVSEAQIRDDLDVLVRLADEHKDFLASVRVAIVAGGFTVVSRGPFRRPIQFSNEESLALLLVVPFYYFCTQSALHTEYRYVLVIHYFLFLFAAFAVYSIACKILVPRRMYREAVM